MNFLIITCRRLAKEKTYALLCIFSLAIGLACSILIALYLLSELTFDRYHQNHEHIYRVTTSVGEIDLGVSGYEVGPILVNNNPQFLEYVRIRDAVERTFTYKDNTNSWKNAFLADASVFDIFTIVAVDGDMVTAFDEPFSIAISESFAEFYFAETDPIGEILYTENHGLRVTLVYEDLPENVSYHFDALLPYNLIEIDQPNYLDRFADRFISGTNATFIHVVDELDPQIIEEATDYLFDTYMTGGYAQVAGDAGPFKLGLQKLSEMHFSNLISETDTGNTVNLMLFGVVAIALLAISCINYINLATARAAARIKEVAMKKILGAGSGQLVFQFLAESVLFIGLAFAVSLLLAIAAIELGFVNSFIGKTELIELLWAPNRLVIIALTAVGIYLLSGFYPAYKLSQPSMLEVLRPVQTILRRGIPVRQLLVFLQVAASIVIVTCVCIMLQQLQYLNQAPLGFKKENQLVVTLRGVDAIRSSNAVKTELGRHQEILSVVEMTSALGRGFSVSVVSIDDDFGLAHTITTNGIRAGDEFLETFEIELLQGTMYRDEQATNEFGPILVNETLVRELQWTQAIGKRFGGGEVIGVINDFHYLPLRNPIAPMVVSAFNDGYLDNLPPRRRENASIDLVISVSGNEVADTRAYILEVVDQFSDQELIEVIALTDVWNGMYEDETQIVALVAIFGGISIIISLLGLAGLSAYNTQQRAKEVAIRKVLGASVSGILGLLTAGTIKVIGVATLPAFAGAYYLSNVWLERFSYRAEFSILPYLLAITLVSFCSIAVLVIQSYRTARANPVARLKYE